MRVVLLGSTGFLGGHIAAALAAAPVVDEVVAVGRDELDLESAADHSVAALFERCRPDAVINASGRTSGDLDALLSANAVAVERLVESLRRVVPAVRYVHLGSAAEYGPGAAETLTAEASVPAPSSPYGEAKLAGTQAVLHAAEAGLDAVVLRVFNPVGWGAGPATMPAAVARKVQSAIRAGAASIETGPLDAYRDFVDADDVADAVVRSAVAEGALSGAVLNVGSGQGTQARDLVELLVKVSGFEGVIDEAREGSARSGGVSWQVGDVGRARAVLGWRPRRSLSTSVEALWDWVASG